VSERLLSRLRASVFAKLLAIMLGMGLAIPLMVAMVVALFVRPAVNEPFQDLMVDYAEHLAATSPNLETARIAGARHALAIRYEGPAGAWTTQPGLPTVDELQRTTSRASWLRARLWSGYHVVARPDGSRYLFAWDYQRQFDAAHVRLLLLVVVLVAGVVLVGHTLLNRTLQPLRSLREGVAALSDGDLEVRVPRRTNDELGALADAFNQMVGRVRERVRARDQLLLDVSHELRSPLTRMRVALALCPDDEHNRRLGSNLAEMEGKVTELLELERLRHGRGLQLERCDLMPIIRERAASFRDRAPGVRLGAAPAEAMLTLDPEKVRSVFSNLLENASKYALPDSKPVVVAVKASEGAVEVKVEDDGPGIPEADFPKLFEPFFRVDRSRSRKTGGYGLGLSLCKRVMEAHGGKIAVENNPGRGTSFLLTFPRPE
jgi:signal transduction histidine kinase